MKKSVIKSGMVKQASTFNLLACALRKLVGKESESGNVYYPSVIGRYKLASKIKKTNTYNNYGIGIYKDTDGKKVFIKTWKGKIKNFSYYSLINEYNMAKILSEKIKNIGSNFKVPNPIEFKQTKNSISVIFEYIDGKPLTRFPINKQSRVIIEAILFLGKLTKTLNSKDQKYIKKRGIFFHFFSLPAIFFYSFLLEKESRKTIFYSFIKIYFYSISMLSKKMELAHGDLKPDNILVIDSHFYILDTEHMKYTLEDYDLNYLSIGDNKKTLFLNILNKRKDFIQDNFLCHYISLQFSIFRDAKTMQRPYFDFLKN